MASRSEEHQSKAPALLWWRDDLRLADNPALKAAAASNRPVVSIFVLDRESVGVRPLGAASAWWVHHSLAALSDSLERIGGGGLVFFRGAARDVVGWVVATLGVEEVFWNRRYTEAERRVDDAIARDLGEAGVAVQTFNGSLLHEPDDVLPKSGGFFHVFGPYWRASRARPQHGDPLPAPQRLEAMSTPGLDVQAVALDALELLPRGVDWTGGLRATWRPGEASAGAALNNFVSQALDRYETGRNDLSAAGSSRLSPHLRHGEISAVAVAQAIRQAAPKMKRDPEKFLQELVWRDFAYNLLAHAPEITQRPYAPRFQDFPWRRPQHEIAGWQKGKTGYPIVDAGMRQLWQTGWMHNRVRMITASFLVKHLLVDWTVGEAWFWDTLCDADPANNVVNWQWVAGCGPDAAPFFRIFNPVLQGEKFDPGGAYVKHFVPELAKLDPVWIHKPWEAPAEVLRGAGIELGRHYPVPIVDHATARARALDRFRATRPERPDLDRDAGD